MSVLSIPQYYFVLGLLFSTVSGFISGVNSVGGKTSIYYILYSVLMCGF